MQVEFLIRLTTDRQLIGDDTNLTAPLSPQSRARLLVALAAILWSTSGLFAKSPAIVEIPLESRGMVLAGYRALFASLALIPFVRRSSIRWKPGMIPLAISFAAMNILFFAAITRTTAAAAVFLQYTSTGWAFLFGAIFLKEPVQRGNLFALACAVVGIVWIVAFEPHEEHAWGNILAITSGACYAGVILSLRHLRGESSSLLILICQLTSFLVLLPWLSRIGTSLQGQQWGLLALLGVVQMALPYVIFARGTRDVTAQEAALITLLEPLFNAFWVWLVWNEPVASSVWIGGAFILGGLLMRYSVLPARIAQPE